MTAAAAARGRYQRTYKHKDFTLVVTKKAWKGARAFLDPTTGKVTPTPAAGLVALGVFAADVDATSAEKAVPVDLEREVVVEFFANATSTDAVAATDVGKYAYHLDDQTVGILATGRCLAGLIWAYDSAADMVGVEKVQAGGVDASARQPATGAFAANDYVVGATMPNGAIVDVPTTAAASTVTLPAAAPDGTILHFFADGTKNGHTVTYRDATGPVNLTTALTASKRHLVTCAKRDGIWTANAYISP